MHTLLGCRHMSTVGAVMWLILRAHGNEGAFIGLVVHLLVIAPVGATHLRRGRTPVGALPLPPVVAAS